MISIVNFTKLKDKILELRLQGKTYNQIQTELGCSKSTIAYHCSEGQKEKTYNRTLSRRNGLSKPVLECRPAKIRCICGKVVKREFCLQCKMQKHLEFTKKEFFDRAKNWQSARSNIQKISRRVYKLSNKEKACLICGYNNHYEVAHLQSVSSFSEESKISEINHIDNLIALCPNHHWEYDNGVLKL